MNFLARICTANAAIKQAMKIAVLNKYPKFIVIVGRVLETLGSRRVSVNEIGLVCFGTESPITRYAASDNQK